MVFLNIQTYLIVTFYLSESYSLLYKDNDQNPIARGANLFINTVVLPGVPTSWSSLATTEPGFDLNEEEMIKFKIWPNAIIPYFIDEFSFDGILRNRIRELLSSMSSVSGIIFSELLQPPTSEKERWVLFINRRGILSCEDYTTESFTSKGVQRVVLGYDCVRPNGGALAPIVLALAGVPPQHNAPNRDKYINVVMENIIPEKRILFKKLNDENWLFQHVRYDFLSAGHYNFHKYTINGSATIVPKEKLHYTVGEDDGISITDIWKIRMLYNYIIFKKRKANATDCQKIFKRGSIKYESDSDDSLMPRKKSNKYLGLKVESESDEDESAQDSKKNKNTLIGSDEKNDPIKRSTKISPKRADYQYSNIDRSEKFRLFQTKLNRKKLKLQEMHDFDTDEK